MLLSNGFLYTHEDFLAFKQSFVIIQLGLTLFKTMLLEMFPYSFSGPSEDSVFHNEELLGFGHAVIHLYYFFIRIFDHLLFIYKLLLHYFLIFCLFKIRLNY